MDRNIISERYFGDEITRYGFISHMEAYIKQLLTNALTAHIDDYLKEHGLTDEQALSALLKKYGNDEESSVLLRTEKIKTGEDGKDIFVVTYKLPRKDYKKKMRRLFIDLFESNVVEGCPIEEEYKPQVFGNQEQMIKDIQDMDKDGKYAKCGGLDKKVNETDCGGCMQGGGDNPDAGQFVAPLTKKPITRTILMNEDQLSYLKEMLAEDAPAVMNTPAGDFGYDAPGVDVKKDDPTLNHKNILVDDNLKENKKKIGARRKS